MTKSKQLRQLMTQPGLIVAPACVNPLTARIAEQVGFKMINLSGFASGASACTTEPLATMTEIVETAGAMARRVKIPFKVDGGAGFGEPLHTMRLVRELIWAGVASVSIEDQIFPKRAHYHRDYREHTVPLADVLQKLEMAMQAREEDPDFVVMGRTDTMRTHGYDEGIRRANAFFKVGVDVAMLFPNNHAEAERAPRDAEGPLMYVNSWGNRVGRPLLTAQEAEQMGYKFLAEPLTVLFAMVKGVREAFTSLYQNGKPNLDQDEILGLRQDIEDLIGLNEYYKVEERTVERAGS